MHQWKDDNMTINHCNAEAEKVWTMKPNEGQLHPVTLGGRDWKIHSRSLGTLGGKNANPTVIVIYPLPLYLEGGSKLRSF